MQSRKLILNTRKQSRIDLPKENLWFFSEDFVINPSPVAERKSFQVEQFGKFKDEFNYYQNVKAEQSKPQKDCSFVVDWQISDRI